MKFCTLVFELSRSQVTCSGGCATRPKPIYPQTASGDIIKMYTINNQNINTSDIKENVYKLIKLINVSIN